MNSLNIRVTLFVLFVSSIFIQAAKQNQFTNVPGRSGDIILKPKNFEDKSLVFLLNRYVAELNEVSDQSIADLVSHSMGGPIINTEISREGFPKGTLFDKSNANLMINVDSVNSELLSQFEDLKLFQMKSQPNQVSGKQIKLTRSSYPQDTIATLATVSSGTSILNHGITGASWATSFGQIEAYRSGAFPLSHNLADLFSEQFEGRSLIVSGSSDFQMTSAFAVNQFSHSPLNNNVAYYFNTKTAKYESIYNSNIATTLSNSWKELITEISTSPFTLPNAKDTMTYLAEKNQIDFNLVSKDLKASFLIGKETTTFFVEMQFVRNLVNALRTEPNLKSLVADKVPDLFSFSFASLKGLESRYGASSPQYKIAIYLLDELLVETINSLSTIYETKLSVEVIFLDTPVNQLMRLDTKTKSNILSKIKNNVQSDVYENNYPSIYLKDAETDLTLVCQILQASTPYDVYCPQPDYNVLPSHVQRQINNQSNTTGNLPTKNAETYQIVVWFSIVLIIALLATIITFCCLDVGADSMIYRSTNLKHQHIN